MITKQMSLFVLIVGVSLTGMASAASTAQYSPKNNTANLPTEDVQRFTTAINEIKKYYVDDVEDKVLFENAIRGMLSGLDPHSSYLDVQDFQDLKSHTSGHFGGLGIEITSEDGYIRIVSPIDDTPAAEAGLKPGDLIVKIDNIPVQDMSLTEAVDKMRGPADSKVTLTIYRKSDQKVFNETLTRAIIRIQSVKSRILEEGYGYIRVSQFQEPTMANLNQALAQLKKENKGKPLKGIVLDLRNNPGGLLDSAIDVSNAFLDSKKLGKNELIVYTKGRIKGADYDAYATPGDLLNGAPIIVLINGGSASGSEIVAGALQDHQRAVIMGTKSFGKGSVQTVLPLDDYRGIKLTTALYYTPSGRSIQAKGIEPDVYVEMLDVKKFKNEDMIGLVAVKEADLEHHIDNAQDVDNETTNSTDKKSTSKNVGKKEKTQPLAVTDYQLYEALNLLKGLNVVKKSTMASS